MVCWRLVVASSRRAEPRLAGSTSEHLSCQPPEWSGTDLEYMQVLIEDEPELVIVEFGRNLDPWWVDG